MGATARQQSSGGVAGLIAARPAASASSGGLYFATDDTTDGPNGTLWNSNGTAWSMVPKSLHGVMGWFSMRDYGADLTGASDTTGVFNTIKALLDVNRAGTIYFPQGKYLTSTGYVLDVQGATLVGEAQSGVGDDLSKGSTQILVGSSAWGLTIGATGSTEWRGYRAENLHFYENSAGTASGGVWARRVNDCNFVNCSFGRFTKAGANGFFLDGTGDNAQYNNFINCRWGFAPIAFRNLAANGTHFNGGCYFEGNTTSPVTGSIALKLESGDSADVNGRFQGFDTLVEVGPNLIHRVNIRAEVWKTQAIHVIGSGNTCRGAQISIVGDNSLAGSIGSGIVIDSGAQDIAIVSADIRNTASKSSRIIDNGTGTRFPPVHIAKAGPVTDDDYPWTPPDGTVAADTTNKRIQVRLGGAWYYGAALTALISRVKLLNAASGGLTGVTTFGLTVPAGGVPIGHHVVLGIAYGGAVTRTVTVTDSRSNTYATATSANLTTGDTPHAMIVSARVTTALQAADTITFTFSGTVNYPSASIYEYAGLVSSSWLDQTAAATGTSTSPSSGNITTTQAQELLFGCVCNGNNATFTAGSGYTLLSQLNNNGQKQVSPEDQVVTSTGTYAATGTLGSSTDWAACIASFKSA